MTKDLTLQWVENTAKQDIDSGEVTYVNGTVGEPRATDVHSSEELSKMGAVGIYKREGDQGFKRISSPTSSRLNYGR
jgi:hypothetical protein